MSLFAVDSARRELHSALFSLLRSPFGTPLTSGSSLPHVFLGEEPGEDGLSGVVPFVITLSSGGCCGGCACCNPVSGEEKVTRSRIRRSLATRPAFATTSAVSNDILRPSARFGSCSDGVVASPPSSWRRMFCSPPCVFEAVAVLARS